MIPYSRFRDLRLFHFIDSSEIRTLKNWEFMGQLWIGEAVGFSEWLRLMTTPHSLGSIALDLCDLPDELVSSILSEIELPLRRGMTLSEVEAILGSPIDSQNFVPDRQSFDFHVPGQSRYDISCTLLNDGGLAYLVVTIADNVPNNSFNTDALTRAG